MDDILSKTAEDVPHRDVPRGADIVSEILFRNFVTFGISSCSIVRYPIAGYTVAFDGHWPATRSSHCRLAGEDMVNLLFDK